MSARQKRVVLSIEQKLDAIKRFEDGKSLSKVVSKFNVVIKTAASNDTSLSKRKITKMASLDDLDKALFLPFSQKQAQEVSVSGSMLVQNSIFFNDTQCQRGF